MLEGVDRSCSKWIHAINYYYNPSYVARLGGPVGLKGWTGDSILYFFFKMMGLDFFDETILFSFVFCRVTDRR